MGKEKASADETIRTIRRRTQRKHSAEEKIRIVLEGLRGENSIAELCRREGIAQSLYYKRRTTGVVGSSWRQANHG